MNRRNFMARLGISGTALVTGGAGLAVADSSKWSAARTFQVQCPSGPLVTVGAKTKMLYFVRGIGWVGNIDRVNGDDIMAIKVTGQFTAPPQLAGEIFSAGTLQRKRRT